MQRAAPLSDAQAASSHASMLRLLGAWTGHLSGSSAAQQHAHNLPMRCCRGSSRRAQDAFTASSSTRSRARGESAPCSAAAPTQGMLGTPPQPAAPLGRAHPRSTARPARPLAVRTEHHPRRAAAATQSAPETPMQPAQSSSAALAALLQLLQVSSGGLDSQFALAVRAGKAAVLLVLPVAGAAGARLLRDVLRRRHAGHAAASMHRPRPLRLLRLQPAVGVSAFMFTRKDSAARNFLYFGLLNIHIDLTNARNPMVCLTYTMTL